MTMKISKKLQDFIQNSKKGDTYWVEKAKLDFAIELNKFIRASKMTNKDLAEKLGTSPAYITKILKGDANFTIESMVKAARAANAKVNISIIDDRESARSWIALNSIKKRNKNTHYNNVSKTDFTFSAEAANDCTVLGLNNG